MFRVLAALLILSLSSYSLCAAKIVLPKCCMQHEIVSEAGHCIKSDSSSALMIKTFNYTFKTSDQWFYCQNPHEIQIQFCMNRTAFAHNYKSTLVRKDDINFALTTNNYCIDLAANGNVVFKMCQPEYICELIPCHNRCCKPGHNFDNCQKEAENLDPLHGRKHEKVHGIRIRNLTCKPLYSKTGYYFGDPNRPHFYEKHHGIEYCEQNLNSLMIQFMYVKLCAPVGGSLELVKIIGTLLSYLGIFSAIIFYIVVPELRDLHGKLVLSLLVTMLFAYLTLAFGHNLFFEMEIGIGCKILGYFIYFTALSMFSWSNVLCFNIYRLSTFQNRNSDREEDRQLYTRYFIYAVCYPIFMLILLILLDSVKSVPPHLSPSIGTQVCFFADTTKRFSSYLILFFIPSGIHIFANWIFFVLLVRQIVKTMGQFNIGRQTLKFSHASKLFLMLKLSLVMGLPWTLELSLFFWNINALKMISDFMNTMSGFILFFVFVLNKSTFLKCRKRYSVEQRVKNAGVKVLQETPTTSMTSLLSDRGSGQSNKQKRISPHVAAVKQ